MSNFKIEGRIRYFSDSYLYTPNPLDPRGWKLRIKDVEWKDGRPKYGVTEERLQEVAAQLHPHYAAELGLPPEVIKRLRRETWSLYRSLRIEEKDIPSYLSEQAEEILVEGTEEGKFEIFFEGSVLEGSSADLDPENGILRNRPMLGLKSKNGYEYTEGAAKEAFEGGKYEGAAAYINHLDPKKETNRDALLLAGEWKNTRWDETTKIGRGDLHTLKAHRERIFEWAEKTPRHVAPSHVVRATLKKVREGGVIKKIIEHIGECLSCDLVANPATIGSFMESEQHKEVNDMELLLKDATLEDLRKKRPELVKALQESVNPSQGDGVYKELYEAEIQKREEAEKEVQKQKDENQKLKEKEENTKKLTESLQKLKKKLENSPLNQEVQETIFSNVEKKGKVLTEEAMDKVIETQVKLIEAQIGHKLVKDEFSLSEEDDLTKEKGKKSGGDLLSEAFEASLGIEDEEDKEEKSPDKAKK